MNQDSKIALHTGSQMPILGIGSWELTDDTEGAITYALERGYRMIDTSSDYGSQQGIGEALAKTMISRDDLFIVTKVEETDDAYERTKSNLDELGLDYVDLMLIHRPPSNGAGEGLWEGLVRARKEGLIKDIGVSNYSSELIDVLMQQTNEAPVVNQIEWTPFGYSDGMLEYCQRKNIIIQAYSPLTRGKRLDDETLNDIAEKYGKSPAQILIRWNLQRGTVPIPKANQKDHIAQNIDVFDFEIEQDDLEVLNGFNEQYSSLGTLPYV